MKTRDHFAARFFSVLAIAFLVALGAGKAGAGTCTEGLGVPPFLAQGEDPNILMIIDNSASMYDLAYVPPDAASQGYCFDDSYDPNKTPGYFGYFEHDVVTEEPPVYSPRWYSYDLDNDKFVQVADQAAMTTACNAAAGTKYYELNNQVCVKIDAGTQVTYFGANSNFLNWAAASKFDVEKMVLTGGKYAEDPSAAGKYLMVMESRGCNGMTFFKQVAVSDGTNALEMALGVRAEAQTATLPVSDYLTRIDIHKITTSGISFAECKEAIDQFLDLDGDGLDADGHPINQASIRASAEACLIAACPTPPCTASASKNAFNAIMQECWYKSTQGHFQPGGGSVTSMKPKCEDAYKITNPPTAPPADYVDPSLLAPTDICFGIYGVDGTGSGWVGKCLEPTWATGTAYVDITCTIETPNGSSAAPPENLTSPYTILPDLPLNDSAKFCATNLTPHVWKYCSGNYSGPAGGKSCNKAWLTAQKPNPDPASIITSVKWTDDLGDTAGYNCIDAVLQEYCGTMDEPSVTDPSDAKSSQDITFNIPAFLVLAAGEAHVGPALLTMKGLVERSAVPTGILHEYKNDMRFGTMALNDGTFSECMPIKRHVDNTQYVANLYDCLTQKGTAITAASTADPLKKDGAAVQTYIGKGAKHFEALIDSTNSNHKGINNIVATTWTPTAEAYYEAIGYYTQKAEMRINTSDFYVNSVDAAAQALWIGNPSTHYAGTRDNPVYVRDSNNKMYMTYDDGWSSPKQVDGVTDSTGPADDGSLTLTWIPIDPVVNYCQSNNILILTDGASTADQRGAPSLPSSPAASADVFTLARVNGDSQPVVETTATSTYDCGALLGSTLLDDLTYYGFNGSIYPVDKIFTDEETGLPVTGKNILSFIISTGELRDVLVAGLPAECDSHTQLDRAANNGGSNLLMAENPIELRKKIKDVLDTIKAGTASGSASSVISASRGGEGAIYQAIFWPKLIIPTGDNVNDTTKENEGKIRWIGDVHSLLIDTHGKMYEDDGDIARKLNQDTTTGAITNTQVTLYYDAAAKQTKACNGTLNDDGNACDGTSKELKQVHYLWSAADWLSAITDANITSNRADYLSNVKQRYIKTWIDLNNDGVVNAATEWLPFTAAENLGAKGKSPLTRGPVTMDFGVSTTAEVNAIVDWVRGLDTPDDTTIRSRQRNYSFAPDWNWADDPNPTAITWRLADVINSTPTAVTRPSEGYHLLYKDTSYAGFVMKYNNRRHMIYFGSNGGMLHAVNGGFYDDVNKRFCLTLNCQSDDGPALGAEMWAYVPYNLLPHLKCLMDPSYEHKYYVDLRPRILDARLWWPLAAGDITHTNGWGTLLIVGMRFGGSPVDMNTLDAAYPSDDRRLASSYIIFDVTDPEHEPVLLGELTYKSDHSLASMGYTTAIPTVVPMKRGDPTNPTINNWYLILGSGPTDIDGTSNQQARLAVFDLKRLITPAAFRIDEDAPGAHTPQTGRWLIGENKSFISDLITVDFELNTDYMADVVYFGTVSGRESTDWGDSTKPWGGKMYRLVTRKLVDGTQEESYPSEWAIPNVLFNAGQPVTAAAAVGTDYKNIWVYFGTGRFFDRNDKSDSNSNATQHYYGIKEPKTWSGSGSSCTGEFNWEEVETTPGGGAAVPGNLGLLDVTQIRVASRAKASEAALSCADGSPCLPGGVLYFNQLVDYIAGTGNRCDDLPPKYGTDGWYKALTILRERNLGQATLLGGLLTFTTYQPFLNLCLPEGLGFLYGLYFQTGTSWHKGVFSTQDVDTEVVYKIDMGRGLSTTPNLHIGQEEGGKAFAQTSTGAIVEIEQPNLPLADVKTGRQDWRQIKPAVR